MSALPDFTPQHYQTQRELGHNRAGGRVTYLATDVRTQQPVVIKQFQFAKTGSSWTDYDSYHREVQLLKDLEHPGIPRYLATFQTDDGFCMVQEYKPAATLSAHRSFSPDAIQPLAIAVLDILIYLQCRVPVVIHRDIKPDNILLDDQGNVYLVDFGFAHVGEGDVGVSSVVKGTLGFMPPEQLFNRQLTEASDLYGLGMTLICLLTGTSADQIGNLVDISYRVSFRSLVPKLNQQWVNWLEKMVEPRHKDRYPNAIAARAALPIMPLCAPDALFSESQLDFTSRYPEELLVKTITITNPIPDTLLEGRWELSPHPHDPPAPQPGWIAVEPSDFSGNQVVCAVTVDTRRLMAGKVYYRTLYLQSNTLTKTYGLTLRIQTPRTAASLQPSPYPVVLALTGLGFGIAGVLIRVVLPSTAIAQASARGFGVVMGAAVGFEVAVWLLQTAGWRIGAIASTWIAALLGLIVLGLAITGAITLHSHGMVMAAIAGFIGSTLTGIALGIAAEYWATHQYTKPQALWMATLAAALGLGAGVGSAVGFDQPLVLTELIGTGFGLTGILMHRHLQNLDLRLSHRRSQHYFIRP